MRKAIVLVLATVLFSACATVPRANTRFVPEYAKAEFEALQNKYPAYALRDDVILEFFPKHIDASSPCSERYFLYHAYKVRNSKTNACSVVAYFPEIKEEIYRFGIACNRPLLVSEFVSETE